MGVPLVLPHTSLTIPARPLHNLTIDSVVSTHSVFFNTATKYAVLIGNPEQSPFALRE